MTDQHTATRPFPEDISALYAPHFLALRERRLVVRQCLSCRTPQWPARPCCPRCLSADFDWIEVPPHGTVYTFTVCHRGFQSWFAERTPYGVVVAQVAPDVRIVGTCLDTVDRLECDVPVAAAFTDGAGGQVALSWEVPER